MPYIPFDISQNIEQIFSNDIFQKNIVYISNINKIPPLQIENVYNSVALFTLPQSFINSDLLFFLSCKIESESNQFSTPTEIIGQSDPINSSIIKEGQGTLTFTWNKESQMYNNFLNSKGIIEVLLNKEVKQQNDNELANSVLLNKSKTQINRIANALGSDISQAGTDQDKWKIVYKELSQKQEMMHHLLQELDDKTEALKLTGAEIIDLRRQIKLLQSENHILRKKLSQEAQMEVTSLVAKEIGNMSIEQLKEKILKIAQAYRNERVKNEELEKAQTESQKEVLQGRQIIQEHEELQKQYQILLKKSKEAGSEISRIQVYKETIKKQEKVIEKLEKMLEDTIKEAKNKRNFTLDLEKLKTENYNLQKQLKIQTKDLQNDEIDYKNEYYKLTKLVEQLREELLAKRPKTAQSNDIERENMELSIKLDRSNARYKYQKEQTLQKKNQQIMQKTQQKKLQIQK